VSEPAPERSVAPSADEVASRVESVRKRIERAGGDPTAVRIVAVTKGFPTEAVVSALDAGIRDIGENYTDELVRKAEALEALEALDAQEGELPSPASPPTPWWHYLGVIQRRRVRDMAGIVGTWQTVSRTEEAEQIAQRVRAARIMIQIEATGLPGRNGCSISEAPSLASRCRSLGLDLCGLMTIAPQGSPDSARAVFRTVAGLAQSMELDEMSMGMTDDLELAVEAGATMVRVGRALFGERHRAPRS
jgi:PLP dependent protein